MPQLTISDAVKRRFVAEAIKRGIIGLNIGREKLAVYSLEDFRKFLKDVSPHFNWDWLYLRTIQKEVMSVGPYDGRSIFFEVPIRHGKSELITKHYPIGRLKADPRFLCGIGVHTAELAGKFGRSMRRMALRSGIELSKERNSAHDWETTVGGGIRLVGVGGPLAGYGFNHLGMDDPIKNREQAESTVYRDKVWDWMMDDLLTRREPGCNFFGVMSRWHEDDPVGRIKRSPFADDWEFIYMPAIAMEGDLVGRKVGEALCPDRFSIEYLRKERIRMGVYSFSGLFQQDPIPREGAMFNVSKLDIRPQEEVWEMAWPSDESVRCLSAAMGHDRGATVRGDETVCVVMAGPTADGLYLITDMMHGDWEPARTDSEVDAFVAMFPAIGRGAITLLFPQDPGQAGKDQSRRLVARYGKYSSRILRISGSKEVRAEAFASQVNAGNVIVARGRWLAALIEQMRSFPLGVHDDIIDALADAYNHLSGRAGSTIKPRSARHV